jgi:alpha-L-fucosidase 2
MLRPLVSLLIVLGLGVPLHAAPKRPARAAVQVDVDWPAFLGRHDLVWNRRPKTWGEGAFTGNGRLGAMLSETPDGRHLRWHIGRSDVVLAGARLNDVGIRPTNRIPLGDLVLVGLPRVKMRLDLWNAEVTGEAGSGAGVVRFRTFTAADPDVQVIELTAPPAVRFNWEPAVALDPRLLADHQLITNEDRSPSPVLDTSGPAAVSVQPLHDGGEHATAWIERTIDDGRRIFFLSVGYAKGRPGAARKEAVDAVTAAAEAGLDRLVASHRAWWHAYWPQSFVSIPDTRLESFYWIQMYKLAAATRADRPMIDLMGPWYDATPWPRIWWNLNAQLTYWPVLGANRLELGESLLKTIDACGPMLAENAAPWSEDSSAMGRTSSYDCRGPATRELCNLPWALHNYWLHYRHTMDEGQLRRLLPVLRRSMSFYLHLLAEGADGRLHLSRGMSPEYDTRADHPDCTIDVALLRWGLETIVENNRRLGLEDPRDAEWRRTLERLAPYPVNANGLMVAGDTPYATSHRHYSHLFPIFPLYLLRWDRPADRDLIERSFDHWMSLPERFRGYSWTGAASIAASIERPKDAVRYLTHLLEQPETPILPNTMYREAGPVIETPLSGASALHDLLLQSWGDALRIFPGVSDAWPDVAFHHLRAQGAFLVSAVRREGRTRLVRIESLAGAPCVVVTDMGRFRTEPRVSMRKRPDGAFELGLKRGQAVVLMPEGDRADLVIAPVAPKGPLNSYGLP